MEKPVKILVVDDDNNLRETLVDLLEMDGYKVYQAATAAECLDLCASEFFNIILMDYNLPDENGIHLAVQGIDSKKSRKGRHGKS